MSIGHRERLRGRFEDFGPDSLNDHELLEMLLFFSIPRRDTNAIAHNLLKRFGSLSGVLAAPIAEMSSVDGVGEGTALLLKLVNELTRRARMTNIAKKPLGTLNDLCNYCCELLAGERSEQFCVILMDSRFNLIRAMRLSCGVPDSVNVYPRMVAEQALKSGAAKIALTHNHPSGDCTPSPEDFRTTESISAALSPLGIGMVEHIVVSDRECFAILAQKKLLKPEIAQQNNAVNKCGCPRDPAQIIKCLDRLNGGQIEQVISMLESMDEQSE